MKKTTLKPYAGILAVVLCAVDIFWLSGVIARWSPLAASFISEALLAVIAVGTAVVFRADLRRVFPFGGLSGGKTAGMLIFWMGCFLTAILAAMFMMWLFPEQMIQASQGTGVQIGERSFAFEFLLICVMPAVCEELAFRGVFLNSLRVIRHKWIVIAVVSLVFGAFHGSIWRMVPTAILGAGMAYLLFETGNMAYNMLFHAVNNSIPLLLMRLLGRFGSGYGLQGGTSLTVPAGIPMLSVGMYLIYGASAPLLLYIGNHLIHEGKKGYRRGLFPREKNPVFAAVVASCFGMMALGILLMFVSLRFDSSWMRQYGM